ncbi:MAG: TPM domain-containing protein [bacterium]|nr:TPM domain-containing protein [bacterium]
MDKETKKEARKQYFHYFRFWFAAVAVLGAAAVCVSLLRAAGGGKGRTNGEAPAERVYDYADILTDEEEEKLRRYIAGKEAEYGVDFVILTFARPVEGEEAKEQYHYRSTNWEQNMTDLADDFWDTNRYGFNRGFEGDGSILIDNRYPGQRGEWLSTSGRVENALSSYDVGKVLDAVDAWYDRDPYRAYIAYIDSVCGFLGGGVRVGAGYYLIAFLSATLAAFLYASVHLGKNRAKNTVAVNAYVPGGKAQMLGQGDELIRKNVVKRHIEASSSGGGGSHGGGGGHHTSSGGASHGGGGRRH